MARPGSNWNRVEVEAIVADYLEMFRKHIRGEEYNKTEHRKRLLPLLPGRTEGSIEYKHQNISAVLLDLDQPYLEGYKPHRNYQALLFDVVSDRLLGDRYLMAELQTYVDQEARVPTVDDLLSRMVEPPPESDWVWPEYGAERRRPPRTPPNYLLREARNASLGRAGELFTLNFERARLMSERKEGLAAEVEHVAETRGDYEGFDVLSFETDGRERLIEVKTTAFGQMTPFFVSSHQVTISRERRDRFHIYRLFSFRSDPKLFALPGPIADTCVLEPTEYRARPGGGAGWSA
jgi:hypothetical protein